MNVEHLAKLTLIRGMRAQAEDAMRIQTAKILKLLSIDDDDTFVEAITKELHFCDEMIDAWSGFKKMIERFSE